MLLCFSVDKEMDSSTEDKWSFDGTVRHLPQGMIHGENGPVPSASVAAPEQQQQQTSMPSPSSSSSSTEQLPPQQNNHIEQVRIVTIFVN